MNRGLRSLCVAACVLAATSHAPTFAGDLKDVRGLWLSAAEDAVLDFQPCPDQPVALCGRIVWDKDAGTAASACGVQVAQMERFDGAAWRDGWVYDPRDQKRYKGVLRIKDGRLHLRAFVGSELLGQTEQLTRTASLPSTPRCAP